MRDVSVTVIVSHLENKFNLLLQCIMPGRSAVAIKSPVHWHRNKLETQNYVRFGHVYYPWVWLSSTDTRAFQGLTCWTVLSRIAVTRSSEPTTCTSLKRAATFHFTFHRIPVISQGFLYSLPGKQVKMITEEYSELFTSTKVTMKSVSREIL